MLYSQESGSIRSPINAEAFPLVILTSSGPFVRMSIRGRARISGARSESIKPSLVPRPLPVEKNVSSPPSGLGTRLGTRFSH